jgi:hypothetical protein
MAILLLDIWHLPVPESLCVYCRLLSGGGIGANPRGES